MATLTVGPNQQYSRIGDAVAAARDGDTVAVQAGTYTNDFTTVNNKITLTGVGGIVEMAATTRPGPVPAGWSGRHRPASRSRA